MKQRGVTWIGDHKFVMQNRKARLANKLRDRLGYVVAVGYW